MSARERPTCQQPRAATGSAERSTAPSGAPYNAPNTEPHSARRPEQSEKRPTERSTAPSGAKRTPRYPKSIRLSKEAYRSGHAFSVTIATANRSRLFVNTPIAGIGIICLRQSAAKYGAEVYAFCFMSDHLHILARTPEGTDFSEFIRIFKQISSHRLRRVLNGNHIWQPSYFDHALRSSEDLEAVAKYIFNNPVRAGVVESAAQYPFSGSLVWDVPSKGPIGPVLREDIRGPAKNVTRHLQVPSAPRYREKRP